MLIAEHITKSYKTPVLSDVSLTLGPGEIVGIAGLNGCGKSTLLSILTAVTKPDGGTVTVMGADVFKQPEALRKYVGFAPQKNGLFESLSAKDNLRFWAAAYGAEANTDGFDAEFLRKKAGKLSEGMKKRLSLAIARLNGPLFLLMDEPTAALDIGFKREFLEGLKKTKADGKSALFSSHQPDELAACDRIYLMSGGIFIFEGTPAELAEKAGKPFAEALPEAISTGEASA